MYSDEEGFKQTKSSIDPHSQRVELVKSNSFSDNSFEEEISEENSPSLSIVMMLIKKESSPLHSSIPPILPRMMTKSSCRVWWRQFPSQFPFHVRSIPSSQISNLGKLIS